ncbi:winged helix-turn-helix transcriptional regulator [Streptomyces rectiverticillatus]|nr:winged helix-turn-helix transcriptional regulator [Streptomyces rectiverticillatus]
MLTRLGQRSRQRPAHVPGSPGHHDHDQLLVRDDLVRRKVEPTTPPQVTYGLTEFGRDVGEPLAELFDRITRRLSPRNAE